MLLLTNCNAIQKLQFLAKDLLRKQLKKDKGLGPLYASEGSVVPDPRMLQEKDTAASEAQQL